MHFISPVIVPSGFFIANIMAAPVHPQLSSLAIPSPNSTTYEADIAAVVAYARSHPAPVTAMDTTIAAAPVKECGAYTRMGDNSGTLTYTSEVCKDTAGFEHMEYFFNWYCDLCIVFDGKSYSMKSQALKGETVG